MKNDFFLIEKVKYFHFFYLELFKKNSVISRKNLKKNKQFNAKSYLASTLSQKTNATLAYFDCGRYGHMKEDCLESQQETTHDPKRVQEKTTGTMEMVVGDLEGRNPRIIRYLKGKAML